MSWSLIFYLAGHMILASHGSPFYPLLSKPVGKDEYFENSWNIFLLTHFASHSSLCLGVGQPRSWGRMSSLSSSSRLDGDNQLETLRQNNLDVRDVETKIKKRDSLYDVFEEVYEDYEDDEDAVWTSVGNGRVKIWPLTFHRIIFPIYPTINLQIYFYKL